MTPLFRIKICGITRPDDARAASQAGADAIGLNFYPSSPRFCDALRAQNIQRACPAGLQKVGVFVNESIEDVRRRVRLFDLDWVQLHGDEPPETIQQLAGIPVIRAFRCQDHRLAPVLDYWRRCREAGRVPDAILLDAWQGDHYGGTGRTLDWERLRAEIGQLGEVPWILAGGLHAGNVAEAIRQLRPAAVDTASGVESAPGIKDPQAMADFVQAIRASGCPVVAIRNRRCGLR